MIIYKIVKYGLTTINALIPHGGRLDTITGYDNHARKSWIIPLHIWRFQWRSLQGNICHNIFVWSLSSTAMYVLNDFQSGN